MLRGDSVIDWHRLAFADHAEVDRFLRLNEFDPESDDEMARLEDIRADAVDYLSRAYAMAIPTRSPPTSPPATCSSWPRAHGPHQKWACVVLKVMHIIHHINGRQALLKMSVSDEMIFREIELKVMQVVEQLRAAGAPLTEFEWSRKPRDSQITKLLAKRSTLAANIYDKLRFRLIVPQRRGPGADAGDAVAPADPVQLRGARREREPARRSHAQVAQAHVPRGAAASRRESRSTSSPAPSTASSTSSPTCRCASSG